MAHLGRISAGRCLPFSLLCVLKKVYVTRTLPPGILQPLRDRHQVEVWEGDGPVPRHRLLEAVGDIHGLLSMLTDDIDRALITSAPHLEVVSQMAVGVDNVDVAECRRRGIAVGHTPGVLTETVADTAFALLGAIVRRLPEGERAVRRGRWGPWSPDFLNGGDLHGTVLGVVGMGRIGRAVARRAAGFDMRVIYASRGAVTDEPGTRMDLSELLGLADHVVLCVSLTPETHRLIGRDELASMKETGYLVNVSRGPVVDTGALVEALQRRWIAGVALDVTDPEPLPADHPLLQLDSCLVVPHIASSSVRTRAAMARLAVENMMAALEGAPLPAPYTG